MPRTPKEKLPILNKKQVATMFGVTEKTITTWEKQAKHPMPHTSTRRGTPNEYKLDEIIRWAAMHQCPHDWYVNGKIPFDKDPEEMEDPGEEVVGMLNYNREKARLTKEQADATAIKNEMLRGTLIVKEDVVKVGIPIAQEIRSRLDAVPNKIKKELPHLGSHEFLTIKKILIEAMNAASRFKLFGSEFEAKSTTSDD